MKSIIIQTISKSSLQTENLFKVPKTKTHPQKEPFTKEQIVSKYSWISKLTNLLLKRSKLNKEENLPKSTKLHLCPNPEFINCQQQDSQMFPKMNLNMPQILKVEWPQRKRVPKWQLNITSQTSSVPIFKNTTCCEMFLEIKE